MKEIKRKIREKSFPSYMYNIISNQTSWSKIEKQKQAYQIEKVVQQFAVSNHKHLHLPIEIHGGPYSTLILSIPILH